MAKRLNRIAYFDPLNRDSIYERSGREAFVDNHQIRSLEEIPVHDGLDAADLDRQMRFMAWMLGLNDAMVDPHLIQPPACLADQLPSMSQEQNA